MPSDSQYRIETPEVLYTVTATTVVDDSVVEGLKQRSVQNARRRIRLCAHERPADPLHEMLIVHTQGAYVRPHKHPGKSESMHIIEGEADFAVFDDAGEIQTVTRVGAYGSGLAFFHRMSAPLFHTLVVRSPVLVFHETTNGPFDRRDTVFAPWAPDEGDVDATNRFLDALILRIDHAR